MKIMMVDDHAQTLRAFVRLLGRGFDVTCKSSAREAIERIDSGERFDVVVTEMWFGDRLTGEDLYEHILAIDPAQAARLLFLVGVMPLPAERTRLPRDHYLLKVVARDALIEKLRRIAARGTPSAA